TARVDERLRLDVLGCAPSGAHDHRLRAAACGALACPRRRQPGQPMRSVMATSAARQLFSALDERRAADVIKEALAGADVVIDGGRPWDIRVNDQRMYQRVLRDGTLGVGETFVEGWWD